MQPQPKRATRNPLTSVGTENVSARPNPLFSAGPSAQDVFRSSGGPVPNDPLGGGGGGARAPQPAQTVSAAMNPIGGGPAGAAMQQRQQAMLQQQEQQRRQMEEQQRRQIEEQQRQAMAQRQLDQQRQMEQQRQQQQMLERQRLQREQQQQQQAPKLDAPPRALGRNPNDGGGLANGAGGPAGVGPQPPAPPPQQQIPAEPPKPVLVEQPPAPPMTANNKAKAGAGAVDRVRALVNSVVSASIVRAETKSGLLQSHTTYVIKVNDFGREFEVERRFTDFETLHSDLSRICGTDALPKLPERGWGTSTDPNTVEERKPKLNLVIQACLANKEALFEKSNILWNFLDLSLPAIFCTRAILHGFNYCSNNLIGDLGSSSSSPGEKSPTSASGGNSAGSSSSAAAGSKGSSSAAPTVSATRLLSKDLAFFLAQLHKLVSDSKYEAERYRLEHATMFKIVLGLLEEVDPSASASAPGEQQAASSSTSTTSTSTSSADQVIAACAEILGYTLRKSEQTRSLFLREKGLDKLFRVLRKDRVLNMRVKRVFSSLLATVGGDVLGEALAHSLEQDARSPGHSSENDGASAAKKTHKMRLLDVLTDLADGQRDAAFHDFLAKVLWFVWDCERIQNFFVEQGLFLLSRLFVVLYVNSLVTRIYTALMFGIMLTNHLLDERKKGRVEDGLSDLIRELEPIAFFGQLRTDAPRPHSGSFEGGSASVSGANGHAAGPGTGRRASGSEDNLEANGNSVGNGTMGGAIAGLFAGYSGGFSGDTSPDHRASVASAGSADLINPGGTSSASVANGGDPALRAFHAELVQMGNLQSSLIKIHSCLSDSGNVVAAKLALYFQDGDLETALHKLLMRKVDYESTMVRRHFEASSATMNSQLEFSAQRMMISPPRSLVLHLQRTASASAPDTSSPDASAAFGKGGEEGFFAPLEKQMADYEKARTRLKLASEGAVKAKGSVNSAGGIVNDNLSKMIPKLPLGMTENMVTLGRMCDSSQAQFHEASERASLLQQLETAVKQADEEFKEAERALAKLNTERSSLVMQAQEKKFAVSKLQHSILEAKMHGNAAAGEMEAQLANLQKEVASLEEKFAAGEGDRNNGDARVRAASDKRQQLVEQLLQQREAVKKGNVTNLKDQLVQQKNKIQAPFRKLHSDWRAVMTELLRTHVTQAGFHGKLRDLARALVNEQQQRAALGGALARTRDELSGFEQALLVNDSGLDEVTTNILY
eukprot:g11056.t1